jgi:hypothetical protein
VQTRPDTQVRFVNRGVRLPSLRLTKDSNESSEGSTLSTNIPAMFGKLA